MTQASSGTTSTWRRAHAELVRLSRERARLDVDEGHWFLIGLRSAVHSRLGYASFAEYIERLFGYSPRFISEKLRVAEALESLPALGGALANREIPWSVARELTRVATAETEAEWLAAGRGKTARDVEHLVSGHRPGNRPDDRIDPTAIRHVLRFDVAGATLAALREAFAKIRQDADGPLDDDSALMLMARRILEGPSDPGRTSYQLALTVCERCRTGAMRGRGELVPVERDVVEMAECDAQSFSITREATHVGAGESPAKQSIAPSVRRLVHHRDGGRCRVPGCRHAVFVDVHHLDPKADGGSNDPDNLVTLCSAHHRAIHRGELVVIGSASIGLAFRHADGSPYGSHQASPAASLAFTKAFQALRSLGFREGEARHALARITTHVGHDPSTEHVLRQALAELTRPFDRGQRTNFGRKAA